MTQTVSSLPTSMPSADAPLNLQVLGASSVLSSVFSDSPAKPSFVPAKLKLGSLPSPPLSSYIPRGLPFSSLLPMTQTVSSLPTSMPSADAPLNLQTKMYMPTSCISSPAMSLSDQGGFSMPNILERAQFQGPSNAFYSTGDVHLKKKKKKKSKPIMKRKIVSENKQLGIIFWPRLFQLQNEDGFWELTFELGMLLELDVDHLVNVTLAKKGIQSLGPKGKEKLLRLIATLLVLQVVRFKQLQGLTFKSLTKLSDSPPSWALVPAKKATEWARRTEREFPVICQRLELGKDWDSATKNLLRIDTT
uniref:PARP4 MVP-ID C-terminal domain-containing protein n=1 Tax=Anolis carolinensis TaxID=28377 RepID=A0A803T901_ANOCA